MEAEALAMATQFGAAGLIAWMWLSERRSANARESSLAEAHARLMEQRTQVDALMALVRDNTRAVASMESALRSLAGHIAPAATHRGPAPHGTLQT